MTAPGTVKARSSVEIHHNTCCNCWPWRRKLKDADAKIAAIANDPLGIRTEPRSTIKAIPATEHAIYQVPNDQVHTPIPRLDGSDPLQISPAGVHTAAGFVAGSVEWRTMPVVSNQPDQPEGSK